jgi:hypothetical protein
LRALIKFTAFGAVQIHVCDFRIRDALSCLNRFGRKRNLVARGVVTSEIDCFDERPSKADLAAAIQDGAASGVEQQGSAF